MVTTFPAVVGPFTVSDVPPGQYYVRARAWSAFGAGPPSHQPYLVDLQSQVTATFLLPPSHTSISGVLPPGTYRLGIRAGGPCGAATPLPGYVDFVVP